MEILFKLTAVITLIVFTRSSIILFKNWLNIKPYTQRQYVIAKHSIPVVGTLYNIMFMSTEGLCLETLSTIILSILFIQLYYSRYSPFEYQN